MAEYPKEYIFTHVTDFLQVPPDRRAAVVESFLAFLAEEEVDLQALLRAKPDHVALGFGFTDHGPGVPVGTGIATHPGDPQGAH